MEAIYAVLIALGTSLLLSGFAYCIAKYLVKRSEQQRVLSGASCIMSLIAFCSDADSNPW